MTVTTHDHQIRTDRGNLFARLWNPPESPAGSRAAILLLHDSLGCIELWRDFPRQLAAATGRTVVAYDRLGFGRSETFPGPLPMTFIHDEASAVVPRVCESLGLDAIIPFGHSVGGGMAIAAAAHLPKRCTAVITESAQSFVEDRTLAGLRLAQEEFSQPGQLERLARYHGPKARWVLDSWLNTWQAATFANWSLDDELRRVRCSTLALHGDRDEYGSAAHPQRIARLIPASAQAVILKNCGHVPHREQPSRVLSEVVQFLASAG